MKKIWIILITVTVLSLSLVAAWAFWGIGGPAGGLSPATAGSEASGSAGAPLPAYSDTILSQGAAAKKSAADAVTSATARVQGTAEPTEARAALTALEEEDRALELEEDALWAKLRSGSISQSQFLEEKALLNAREDELEAREDALEKELKSQGLSDDDDHDDDDHDHGDNHGDDHDDDDHDDHNDDHDQDHDDHDHD